MPALKFSDPFFEEDLKVTKKKMNLLRQTLAPNSEKEKIKPRASEPEDGEINSDSGDAQDHSPERKKSKKRKSHEDYANGESKSELRESSKEGRKSTLRDGSSKKQRVKEKTYSSDDEERDEEEEERGEEVNPNAVANFRISEILRETLKSKGIESLFPIQAMTFDIILNGSDLVGRARTGQGKTLAFVLPILESLTNEHGKAGRKMAYGRSPSVLVLAPTRELAKQVNADFEFYGGAVGLSSCCLYGGSPYRPQEIALKRGVDIIVGTPGRIKDHIERENIDLRSLKFRVLDEADEMLNMGFVDDVENILGRVEDSRKVQTLLFSATMPDWVKKIASRFLKPEKKTADLVGDDKMKASASVRHIVLPCFYSARAQLIPDIIRCYSSGGRTIVFTETKNSASELAGSLPGARPLHGDIQQSQREVTLAGFRSGKFLVLVATDVAARGLDINDVQLILQCEPPRDVETYIHRSGRTGRAGNTGVAVMLYDRKKSYMIPQIERLSGVKFEHISAPQPADIAKSAGADAAETISKVSDSVVPVFRPAAEQLLNSTGVSAIDLVAKAMAKISGYTEIKRRSLLTSQEDYATVLLGAGRTMHTPTYAFSILRRFIPEEKITKLRGLTLTADGKGAVFDVPSNDLDMVIAGKENAEMVSIDVLNILPPLQDNTNKNQSRGWQGGRGGSDRRGSGGGGGYTGGKGSGGGFLGRRGSGLSNGSQGGRGGGGGHRPQRRY